MSRLVAISIVVCACGRIGFDATGGTDGGSGDADAGGDASELACDTAIELMEVRAVKYSFAAGPYGVAVVTTAVGADTMTVTRFAQQGTTLAEAGQIELDIDTLLGQPIVTRVQGGWLVGATNLDDRTQLFPLTGVLGTRGFREVAYAVLAEQARGDHVMAAIGVGNTLSAVELNDLGQEIRTSVQVATDSDWDDPQVAESNVGVVVSYPEFDGDLPCMAHEVHDGTDAVGTQSFGMAGPTACFQILFAHNSLLAQTMGVLGVAGSEVHTFVQPLDSSMPAVGFLAAGQTPLIVEAGDHYIVTYADKTDGFFEVGVTPAGAVRGAAKQITTRFDDGRVDSMSSDVPVLLWVEANALYAERLCL